MLIPETFLGRFKLIHPLGKGGMGEVWKAEDPRLSRIVAVKILPPDLARDSDLRMRFERESKILAVLNHPNIAQIYEAGEEFPRGPVSLPDKISFLVMEFIEGRSLSEILRGNSLPVVTAVRFARQVLKALNAAHTAGIVHRDLKPANIMVNSQNEVKVLDFGLARPLVNSRHGMPALPEVTASGMVMGTAAYLSPEQVRGEAADIRSDIWAFGCVLYQMLSGKGPFTLDSVPEIMAAILRDNPPSLDLINPEIPPDLTTVIGRCLQKDADFRYQSANEISVELREVLRAMKRPGVEGKSAVLPAPVKEPASSEPSPNALNVQAINRHLKMLNPDFQPLESTGGPAYTQLKHKGIHFSLLVAPKIDEPVDLLAFVAPIMKIPDGDREVLYRRLLVLCNGYTDVAQFAVDLETEMINLTCVRACATLDFRNFEYTMDSMSRIALHFMKTMNVAG